MSNLLYVECSPRKQRSASIEVARAFIDAYTAEHPGDTVKTIDIWNLAMPEFDGDAMAAKYAGLSGTELTSGQRAAWEGIKELARPFEAADKLLFAVPLWNFGIPYKLKHLIDVISQKDVLFNFDESGFSGRLTGKKAAVIYARGLDYFSSSSITPAAGYDFQKPYLEMWLNFVGITDISTIIVEKTLFGPDIDENARAEAKAKAAVFAKEF
ncbi:FMN-dependent NADH-azoreductase [Chelativorans salis]|uniref:FMN dependent NADH:quinone oxidoreductase n=1 Tax=Chelativorans salis TaxID=2978478 RepID=A0ABT2LQJ4_9HYPH|nr:NAD(P)H-dependent oxidoreductase [Chelativorans sp. EGI FJ00035]MCT7376823.1 NAD(P)H-dependent oxidoreductase [Chelativorans sp. EGI FJ00035]